MPPTERDLQTPVYAEVTQNFANDNYYRKGLLLSELMTDGDGNKFVEKVNTYELRTRGETDEASGAQGLFYVEINPYFVLKSGGYTNTIILSSSGLSVN